MATRQTHPFKGVVVSSRVMSETIQLEKEDQPERNAQNTNLASQTLACNYQLSKQNDVV